MTITMILSVGCSEAAMIADYLTMVTVFSGTVTLFSPLYNTTCDARPVFIESTEPTEAPIFNGRQLSAVLTETSPAIYSTFQS